MPPRTRTLVLADGDVAGLLAAVAAQRSGADVSLSPAVAAGHAEEAVARQAEVLGVQLSPQRGADAARGGGGSVVPRLVQSAFEAAAAGIERVIWSVTAGESNEGAPAVGRIATSLDRALLITRLVGLEFPRFEFVAPYADLCDRQLADLILDMDLPIWTCWWYGERDGGGAIEARARWTALLEQAGWRGPLPMPSVETPLRAQTGRVV